MTMVIVGSGGYVGKHLVSRLSELGVATFPVSSTSGSGIDPVTAQFNPALEFPRNAKAVFFLSQSPLFRQVPEKAAHLLAVNAVLAASAAELARRAGIKRFIYASTGNVYAPSFGPLAESSPVRRNDWYALSKLMGEETLGMYAPYMDVTSARIFGVYGPKQTGRLLPNLVDSVLSGRGVFVDRNPEDPNDVNGLKVSLIYIEDLVQALIELTDVNGCAIINLAGPNAVSVAQLANSVAKLTRQQAQISLRETPRPFDLIADTSLQQRLLSPCRHDVASGLEKTLADVL